MRWPRRSGPGLAERDPAADVEGHDSVAKVMILSGLVFGRQLRRGQVTVGGITAITGQEIAQALSAGGRIKHVATLGFDGTANAVVFEASPVGQVTIIGPGAGPELAGQGVLSDVIAVASRRAGSS
jgi:homoserine dehydrogenase